MFTAQDQVAPNVNLNELAIAPDVMSLVPERIARKQHLIAFEMDDKSVKVAMAQPESNEVIQLLAQKTGKQVLIYQAKKEDIDAALELYKRDLQESIDALMKENITLSTVGSEDLPIVKIVDMLLTAAYNEKASDVHIEAEENTTLVRFRIDGVLNDVLSVPKHLHDRIITRLKVLSKLRTDEHLSAQDGKMQLELPEERLDIRVSILPMVEGEKAVLRLLPSKSRQYTLSDLGMCEDDLAKLTRAFKKSFGMILSTGPTGSGKTTTIYSILKILNTRERNLTTIEDPVEYRISKANQVQVNQQTNLTFANGLRSILRQDPNVIFVGEIRDGETAGIAVNAALTGHLVFSTLHTNDAVTTIPRLIDMKIEPFLVASTINVVVAQRLIRKICQSCKQASTITKEELLQNLSKEVVQRNFPKLEAEGLTVYAGKGCKVCRKSGYTGRIGIFEVLEMSQNIRDMILKKADSDTILAEAIKEGLTTMLDDGLQKVAEGVTTLEEVLRVTKS